MSPRRPSEEITVGDATVILVVKRELEDALKPVTSKLDDISRQIHIDAMAHQANHLSHDARISALEKNEDDTPTQRCESKHDVTTKTSRRGFVSEATVLRIVAIVASLALLAMGAKMAMAP